MVEEIQKRTLATECLKKVGEEVTLEGWVQVVRSHGKIAFIDLRDRTGLIQIGAFEGDLPEAFSKLGSQDVVKITGLVKERGERYVNKNILTGTVEIEAKSLEVIQKSQEMPFDMGGRDLELQLPTLLDFRALTLRHPKIQSIFKVQEALIEGFRTIAKKLDCTEIFVPTVSASSTEGGAEVFTFDYFGHQAFLTQSPQLYKQMMVPVFERVYTIAHAYRAEPSVTTRHLTEATQLDMEFGFVDFENLLDLVEEVGVFMLEHAQESFPQVLTEFQVEPVKFGKIPRLTLREAQEIIFQEFKRDSRHEKDLNPQDEADICKWALEKHGSDLVTITHFPTHKRAFYTMPDPKDPEYSLSYDLLFRGSEVLSGSQRINDYEVLTKAITDRGMDPANFELYLQAFKYGMPPEGGLSFGLERMTMNILQLKNIREGTLFPRDMERVDTRFSSIHEKTE